MTEVVSCNDQATWDGIILEKGGHPLQLWGWGEVKVAHGWWADRVLVRRGDRVIGAAQLLIRRLPRPLKALVYVPRGPVCDAADREVVLEALGPYAKREYEAVVLTVEPDWGDMPEVVGWRQSANTVLIRRTLILDLHKSEDELLGAMTKKTRQYIRKSAQDVQVRQVKGGAELEVCLRLYHETAKRAGFGLHSDGYYRDVFEKLGEHSPVFAAFRGDTMVAFLWLAISQATAFELYGGMNDEGQQLRANYALKWQAIHTMKKWGLERYDFNGLLNDGVSTFKRGFADHEDMLAGTYDRPLSPLYAVWNKGLPAVKKLVRLIKK